MDDSEACLLALLIAMYKLDRSPFEPDVMAEAKRLKAEYDRGMAAQQQSKVK